MRPQKSDSRRAVKERIVAVRAALLEHDEDLGSASDREGDMSFSNLFSIPYCASGKPTFEIEIFAI